MLSKKPTKLDTNTMNKLSGLNPNQLKNVIEASIYKTKLLNAKNNYHDYLEMVAKVTGEEFKSGKHIRMLCDKLEKVESGEIKRLMVSMPPRHAKTTTITKYFPSWFIGKNPSKEVVLVAYGANIAYDYSSTNRGTIREYGKDIFNIELSKDRHSVSHWEIKGNTASVSATGVGGPLTGRGAALSIIDDPIKNTEEANSASHKKLIHDWYKQVLRTRSTPDGAIIIVMTRWCEDDLIGRLLHDAETGEGEQWEYITLPAVIEEECQSEVDILGRQVGDVLWEEMFTNVALEATKLAVGIYAWQSMYQQSPVPFKDIIFRESWLKFYEDGDVVYNTDLKQYFFQGEPIIKRIAALDPATGDVKYKDEENYSVIILADITISKKILLRMIYRERILIPEQYQKVVEINDTFNPDVFLIEEVAYQKAIRQTLISIGYYIPFYQINRNWKSKKVRIMEMSPVIQWGRLHLLRDMRDFLDEYKMYPTGKFDDQLDCLEMIVDYVRFMPTYGNPKTGYHESNLVKEMDCSEVQNKLINYIFSCNNESTENEKRFVFA